MNLNDLRKIELNNKKKRKRIGRGAGSGHGKTCCRGSKGARSRSGNEYGILFEGGQMPLFRRLPKRGFTNVFKKHYTVVNVEELNVFTNNEIVNFDLLKERGIVNQKKSGLKILGNGDLKVSLKVTADIFSKSAAKKIEDAGGEVSIK